MDLYPRNCRKNIRKLVSETGVSKDTAYAMLLMTAALMDLNPEDGETVNVILQDCGIFESDIA